MTEGPVKQQGVVSQLERRDLDKEEWRECRSIIGRLDNTLVDLRKIVFGLASGVLTTSGVLGEIINSLSGSDGKQTPSHTIIAVLVSVTMLLIAVSFVVDRYYSVVQWNAMKRALQLEQDILHFKVTSETLCPARSQSWWADWVVLFQYGSFIVVAIVLGVVVMPTEALLSTASVVMWLVCILSITVMLVLYFSSLNEWKKVVQDEL